MTDAARRPMTVEEFYGWESGDDRRYELRDGVPVMMAPTLRGHRLVASELLGRIRDALRGRPGCRVEPEAGLRSALRDRTYLIPDLAVSCAPWRPGERDTPDPLLVVEVLSPSTAEDDRTEKLPDYRAMPSVREVLLIDGDRPAADLHRRSDGDRWLTFLHRGPDAVLELESVGLSLPLGALYPETAGE